MNEISSNSQEIKPKTSRLAIVSLIIPIISLIGSYGFIIVLQYFPNSLGIFFGLFSIFPFHWPLNFILGILALINILRGRGFLKGYIYVILGLLISIPAFLLANKAIGSIKPEARLRMCQHNVIEIKNRLEKYKIINDSFSKVKWCDVLAAEPYYKDFLFCPESPNIKQKQPYKCSYAINPKAEPNSAGDVVLLFETKDGWNQSGGPKLMSFDNHYRKGCNVLFNDGSVKFVSPKNKDKLNWGP